MVLNRKQLLILSILFILLALSFVLLLMGILRAHSNSSDMEISLKRLTLAQDMAGNVLKVTTNAQEFCLYSDQQCVEDFRKYSGFVVKQGLELYNLVSPSKKQEIEDLVNLTQTYNWFVEKELIPLVTRGGYSQGEFKYVQLRHKQFIADLVRKTDDVLAAEKTETGNYFKQEIIKQNNRLAFLLISLLLVLALLIWVLLKIVKPLAIRGLYFDQLSESTKSAVVIVDQRGVIKHLNRSAGELPGWSVDLMLKKNLSEVPALFPYLQNIFLPLPEVMARGRELTGIRATFQFAGKKTELAVDYLPVAAFGRLDGAMLVATRVEELKDKNVLLETLENERKRISIEIHDWIGRHMSTMIHSLDYMLRTGNSPEGTQHQENLLALRSHCQNAAIEMRGIMNNIHPYLIDRVGLTSALESYISTFEKLNQIKVYVYYQDRSLRVKKKDEIIIYRVIQEALTNVAKHGKSTEIDIEFTVLHDTLKIEVADNGGPVGDFAVGKGLWGMKERANLIGGDITYSSSPTGFNVTLTVPIIPGG